jgi:hypothetical protein
MFTIKQNIGLQEAPTVVCGNMSFCALVTSVLEYSGNLTSQHLNTTESPPGLFVS